MRILLVEDDEALAEVLAVGLRAERYATDVATTAAEAIEQLLTTSYDVACFDLGLPDGDGLDLIRQLATDAAFQRPDRVLILTARDAVAQRVAGLDAGADDYLVKPFDFAELLARLRALSRRQQVVPGGGAGGTRLAVGDITLDLVSDQVRRDGRPIDLTPREFALLHALALQAGQVISVDELLAQVWGAEYVGEPQVVYVHIRWLREKIEDDPKHPCRIVTVRGVGYKFEPQPPLTEA